MTSSPRLALPFIQPGQLQKEVVHNEALLRLDGLVQIEAEPAAEVPTSPTVGRVHLVEGRPSGAWADRQNCLATYTEAGWSFVEPFDGLTVQLRDGRTASFRAGGWERGVVHASTILLDGRRVLAGQADAIPAPTGGAVVDQEARAVINQLVQLLRQHGLAA